MSAFKLKTPVAFIIFNRPDTTAKVFEAIRQAKPPKLLVVADGPRSSDEAEKCEETRDIIKKIDWDCEVLTNFSEVNLGCGRRVSSGFDWVFSQVEEAILLEDDTLPDPSFFRFCQTLLERYRDDERVMHINGDNSANQDRTHYSYYFSKYIHSWGWASWRRAWQHYDHEMKSWAEFRKAGLLASICEDSDERQYWISIFEAMYTNPEALDNWDVQWLYACWMQNGLSIIPQKNLVSNLGFNRADAAHTTGDNLIRSKLKTSDIQEISHPPFMVKHRELDRRSYDLLFNQQLKSKIYRRLLSTRKKLGLG